MIKNTRNKQIISRSHSIKEVVHRWNRAATQILQNIPSSIFIWQIPLHWPNKTRLQFFPFPAAYLIYFVQGWNILFPVTVSKEHAERALPNSSVLVYAPEVAIEHVHVLQGLEALYTYRYIKSVRFTTSLISSPDRSPRYRRIILLFQDPAVRWK